jgi:hypothetical protein
MEAFASIAIKHDAMLVNGSSNPLEWPIFLSNCQPWSAQPYNA